MRVQAVIDGLGWVAPVRRSERNIEDLTLTAISHALSDAGLPAAQIDAVVTESKLCPDLTPLDKIAVAARLTGLRHSSQSSPTGAGILAAIGMAVDMVEQGRANAVLTWFAMDWGSATEAPAQYHTHMREKQVIEDPVGFSGPALYFAAAAKRYQHEYGLGDGEMESLLYNIVSAARENAFANPDAQLRKLLDFDAYQADPMIAEPLHAADCSLLSDGAVAMVISRRDRVSRKRVDVGLAGWSHALDPITDASFYTQSPWLPDLPATRRAAAEAFRKSGLGPEQMDVLGIYDCFSIAVPLQLEAAGFCAPGGTQALVQGGALRWDGKLPVNTHGGLMSHGYLMGAAHVAEVVTQLRGEAGARQVAGARRGFAGAGPGRQYTALILERLEP